MTHPPQTTGPQFTDPAEAVAYAEYRQAQAEEYGTWVAAADIRVNGTLAFATGHPVPKSTVEAQGFDLDGLVVGAGTVAPEAGVDRAAQLAARAEALTAELAAIAAEIGAVEEPPPAESTDDLPTEEE